MSQALVTVDKLSVRFGSAAAAAVEDVSFSVERGDRVALIGESGSGKTLTALSILRLLPPGARPGGDIRFDAQRIDRVGPSALRQLRGKRIGIVFQDALASFNPVRTVGSILTESAVRHSGLTPAAAKTRAVDLLSELGVPSAKDRFDAYPHQLSGGLRQRCMIALALINDPDLLIADEPTTALDATIQAQILELLRERSRDKTLIFITHDLVAAARLCNRAILMRHGRIVETGALPGMLTAPRSEYGRELVAATPSAGDAGALPAAVSATVATAPLAVEGISKRYAVGRSWLHALRSVSLSVVDGEILAIVGESGCGKSTLAKSMVGLVNPDRGALLVDGVPVAETPAERARLRNKVQFVFQDPYSSLDPHWSAVRSVAEPLRVSGAAREQAEREAAGVLERVGIPATMHERRPSAFSGGQRQRIAIARALAANPQVLIADEPLSALDRTIQKRIVDLLLDLRRQSRFSLVMVSHDLQLVGHIADRTAVMYLGEIVEIGPADRVIDSPRHRYTAALVAASREGVAPRGETPSPVGERIGCAFAGRCPAVLDRCRKEAPSLRNAADRNAADRHAYACWNPV